MIQGGGKNGWGGWLKRLYISRVRLGRSSNMSLLASKQQNTRSKIDETDQPTDGLTKHLIELRLKTTQITHFLSSGVT